jgi:tetratricopeptide (TPR) repeat protein
VARHGAHGILASEATPPTNRRPIRPRGPGVSSRAPEREASGRPTERKNARYAVLGDGTRRPAPEAGRISGFSTSSTSGPSRRPRRRRQLPIDVAAELQRSGSPREAARLELRLADASRAYERDRYTDALAITRELARAAPGASSVRELHGLTLYRLGRWRDALRELRAFTELTASVDQNPVMADCARALGQHEVVAELYADLRRAGAGSDVLAEGRLVMAGSLADRGRLDDAIAVLEPAVSREVRKPLDRHLRQWYALADLYERSVGVPRARELFRRIVRADPQLADSLERLSALN